MSNLMRLQKFLSAGGVASRRAAEKLIVQGRVKVNGLVVKELGTKVDPRQDKVEIEGRPVIISARKKYFLLYKPRGYLTSVKDPYGRPTVMDLLDPEAGEGFFPVGRLDLDTEGLLLITNDGEMAFRLTHPRFAIEKKYLAKVKGIPDGKKLLMFKRGINLEEGRTAPAKVKLLSATNGKSLLLITLHEGKKRQVKRMCAALGHPVLSLKRIAFSFLTLGDLQPGEYRALTAGEIEALKKAP